MSDAEFEYVKGQGRPTFPALLASFEAASLAIAQRSDARLDLPYGPHVRQKLDFFPAVGNARATLVYFHAGYWQSRDKSTFRFIADAYNRASLHVALINYPLCPEVSVMEIIDAAGPALPQVAALSDGVPLVLSGHSAGAHIAVELTARAGDDSSIVGVVGLSGVYDLRPLVGTSLNAALRLDDSSARDVSPALHIEQGSVPAIFAVGAAETDAFIAQTRDMAARWSGEKLHIARIEICAGDDHFQILQSFTNPSRSLHRSVLALI